MTGDIVALMALDKAEGFADYFLKVPSSLNGVIEG